MTGKTICKDDIPPQTLKESLLPKSLSSGADGEWLEVDMSIYPFWNLCAAKFVHIVHRE